MNHFILAFYTLTNTKIISFQINKTSNLKFIIQNLNFKKLLKFNNTSFIINTSI